ncbi:hypothetical protein [Humibacillus sp. DSM 29435]|uniref:hypothetical protein n=1 Tax=Humibacillus sp. DSM 29435 TaxID=1869167 RepID=UPI0011131B39|nr:hypothetical protein [Humibacillus sp. DSM 29435]
MTASKALGIGVALVIVVVALVFGVAFSAKVKAVVTGVVTVSYDPIKGKLALAADPLALVSRFVTVKVGDEITLTDDSSKATVVITTVAQKAAFEVDARGSWSVRAFNVAGPALTTSYDGDRHVYEVDLSHTYTTKVEFARAEGGDAWSNKTIENRIATYRVVIDTRLLTTGTFTYCSQAPGGCGLYLHALATLDPAERVMRTTGEPVTIPNGAKLQASVRQVVRSCRTIVCNAAESGSSSSSKAKSAMCRRFGPAAATSFAIGSAVPEVACGPVGAVPAERIRETASLRLLGRRQGKRACASDRREWCRQAGERYGTGATSHAPGTPLRPSVRVAE